MKVTFITVSEPAIKHLISQSEKINKEYDNILQVKIYNGISEQCLEESEKMATDIKSSDAVFLDLMGAFPTVVDTINKSCENFKGQVIPFGASSRDFLKLGEFSAESMRSNSKEKPSMEAMKQMANMSEKMGKMVAGKIRDMKNYSLLMKYFQNASEENIYNMLILLLKYYGGEKYLKEPKDPILKLPIGIFSYPTMEEYTSFSSYKNHIDIDKNRDNVLLIFSSLDYPTDTKKAVKAIYEEINKFANVYMLGISEDFKTIEADLRKIISELGSVSLIINTCPFRLAAGPMGGEVDLGINLLKEVDVPYLHPFFLTRRTEENWRESVSGISPSENLLSIMLPELDGAIDTIPVAAISLLANNRDFNLDLYELLPIEERIKHFSNRVKNYLQLRKKANGDKKIAIICYNYPPGEANVFGGAFLDTFESVASILKLLKDNGYKTEEKSAEDLMEVFTAGKAVNSGLYERDFADAIFFDPKDYQAPAELKEFYGEKPGDIMVEDNKFFIPGFINENIFIGLQPSKGLNDDIDSYHDKSLPPHHQYVAFYQWIKNVFEADAIIHVGTHGTLEFLKGKEAGLSSACYPDRLISDLPHIYLYYCGNPAEAVIAKRRSYAQLISYQPPVFQEGGLYGEYETLAQLLDSYRQAKDLSPSTASEAYKLLEEKAKELNISGDIEEELYRIEHSLIPKGLHIFGQGYSDEEAEKYVEITYYKQGEEKDPRDENNIKNQLKSRAKENYEEKNLLRALDGKYIETKLAGDIFRSPEVLPTGFNLHQFDSRKIPSAAAIERGKKIAEETIKKYYEDHKTYPESAAVILWGLETSRTQGETIGQILGYLGADYTTKSVWNRGVKLIPLDQLKRPRIDVTINICGFFRDMFPMAIEGLDDFFIDLFDADEDENMNFFKKHSMALYRGLINQGYPPSTAKQLASLRIFGPPPGEYGTSLTDIINQKNWDNESQLGLSFIASLKHGYSRRLHGIDIKGLYEENLKTVDLVSQLRTNNEYEITDLDHYFEFFGGLAKSVELVKGSKATMYITDTTGDKVFTETVDKSIARGIVTRALNPKWIEGMLNHKVHGGQEISDRFENIMGLAATTGSVEEWIYDDLEETYVKDENIKNKMQENNPFAYMEILEQLMEYKARGYWNASQEQIDRIKEAYLENENNLEGKI